MSLVQAKQNAQMMYEGVMNSITDEAKASLASHELDFYEDRPKLFFHIVNQLFTATFLNAQATHEKLLEFHPKGIKYDILQVNNYIHVEVKTLCVASSAGGAIMEQEILYFQFKIYKKGQVPCGMDIAHPLPSSHSCK